MLPRSSAHLPGTGGRLSDATAEEVLAKQPADTGDFYWLKVEKNGLGTNQVRQAIARSVNVPVELVSDAGNRDRQGRFIQWFSLPVEPVEHPGPLRRAGVHSKMTVLELTLSHKPFTAACVDKIRWKVRLKHANRDGGYLKAKAILDHLRVAGIPNYVGESRLGPDNKWAKWGRILLRGERLPPAVRYGAEVSPSTCRRATQDWLFNNWLAARVADGLLGSTLVGDLILSRSGALENVIDATHADKRVATWEATVQGPLFGAGMLDVSGESAAREEHTLTTADVSRVSLEQLEGGRRSARFQPGKSILDLDGEDLTVACEMPPEANLQGLLDEILKG